MSNLIIDFGLKGLSKAQEHQLSYYSRAVVNYNKKLKEGEEKLELLITSYAPQALIFAKKDLMDLKMTVNSFNQYQKEKLESEQLRLKEEQLKIQTQIEELKEKTENSELSVEKVHEETSMTTSMLMQTLDISQLVDRKDDQEISKEILEVNKEFETNVISDSESKLKEMAKLTSTEVVFVNRVDMVGESITYGSDIVIDHSGDEKFIARTGTTQLVLQEARQKSSKILMTYSYTSPRLFGQSPYDIWKDNKTLLKAFCNDMKIKLVMKIKDDQFFVILDRKYISVTKDITEYGQQDLIDKVVVSLGLRINESIDPYYMIVNKFKDINYRHVPVLFYQNDGWVATLVKTGERAFGLTIHHSLCNLFLKFTQDWFVKVEQPSTRLLIIEDNYGYRASLSYVLNPVDMQYGKSLYGQERTSTYMGVLFMVFINDMYRLKKSMSLDEWKLLFEEKSNHFKKENKIDFDVYYYCNRTRRKQGVTLM
jgi:hypothetical protein